jgi:hypothetical protein
MWLDRVTVIDTAAPWPLGEEQIAALITPVIAGLFPATQMVIDCRPPSARDGATATYRLLSALGLERAAPVAVSFARVDSTYEALDSLVQVCANGGPALVISTVCDPPTHCLVACCFLATDPMTADSVILAEPHLSETASRGSGFIDLLTAALALRPSTPLTEIV